MSNYNFQEIEAKWQEYWESQGLFRAEDFAKKPKLFLLVEFPYPSGAGLHVGHCRSYTALDIIARKARLQGFNALFPMGWDAFGLPTENYALKTGQAPQQATKQNTAVFRKQEKSLGLSFDWSREINTTEPAYYKWTQWIFLKMFEKGLAYKAKMPINWCLSCKIGLANEEVVEGKCERCSGEVAQKEKEQWMLKITDYADRLLRDLDLVDYPERVKKLQEDWIGRSKGWEVNFPILRAGQKAGAQDDSIKVFTTRIDTLFGCTYLVLSPEHPLVASLLNNKLQNPNVKNREQVEEYVKKAKNKSARERLAEAKDKTGVRLEGIAAINPANSREMPIYAADYVLMDYGTGAIMAVPAHDQRDWHFAKKYNLAITKVVKSNGISSSETDIPFIDKKAYEGEGVLVNSAQFDGLPSEQAREKIGQWLKEKGLAQEKVNYKLRDWVFSRQRYWGEPIPLIFCENCRKLVENYKLQMTNSKQISNYKFQISKKFSQGELLNPGWMAVREKDLPVELPEIKNYRPTEKGESPLAGASKWVKTKCPKCGGPAQRETDVMPNWAGSNWYYLRYCDPHNDKELASKEKLKYWLAPARRSPQGVGGVDWYNGGMEHTTLHLLYSRFVYKFLWDIGAVPKELGFEPYKKRTSHGMILAEGGVKMSKSKGNVVNPDDIVKKYGADTLRCYEMFMGPFDQAIAWDTNGLRGAKRFLDRIYKLKSKTAASGGHPEPRLRQLAERGEGSPALEKTLHQTIKKVGEDVEKMKFNTAISSLMVLINTFEKEQTVVKDDFEQFLLILSPFAPHLAEELWQSLGNKKSIFLAKWPRYDKKLIKEEKVMLVVQVNGRVRDKIEAQAGLSQEKAKELALKSPKIKQWLCGKEPRKVIFVKDKLINFVA